MRKTVILILWLFASQIVLSAPLGPNEKVSRCENTGGNFTVDGCECPKAQELFNHRCWKMTPVESCKRSGGEPSWTNTSPPFFRCEYTDEEIEDGVKEVKKNEGIIEQLVEELNRFLSALGL